MLEARHSVSHARKHSSSPEKRADRFADIVIENGLSPRRRLWAFCLGFSPSPSFSRWLARYGINRLTSWGKRSFLYIRLSIFPVGGGGGSSLLLLSLPSSYANKINILEACVAPQTSSQNWIASQENEEGDRRRKKLS